ncbi:hypothetical protein RDABS01_010063 [Bienertia sinuspersici]
MFNRKPIAIKAWAPNVNFKEEVLTIIPLWLRLQNLPLKFWTFDSLSRLRSVMGVPVSTDECTTSQQRCLFC